MLTNAGKALLKRFVEAEERGWLKTFNDYRGNEFRGIALHMGDGGELAAARKLARDGYADFRRGFSNRHSCVSITETGRAALAASE